MISGENIYYNISKQRSHQIQGEISSNVQSKSIVFVIKVARNQHTENELLDRKETPGHAVSLHKRSNIEEPSCNSRCKNVDRIERGQLVFIPSRIRVGGWSERNIVVGTTLAPVYFPTIFATVPVSVALPSPR